MKSENRSTAIRTSDRNSYRLLNGLNAIRCVFKMKRNFFVIAIVLLNCTFYSCQNTAEEKRFKKLSSDLTGIDFNNKIAVNDTFNVLEFPYMYNGSGVAASDFNGDGLTDLFFTANQQSCKLYLNSGGLKFEDVTTQAGLQTNRWCTGVSIADLNQDDLPDIYVSVANHPTIGKVQSNLLFISQGLKDGVPIFKELASFYGLDESSYVSQSVFFDYDKDGDLDAYLLRNHIEKFSPSIIRPIVNDGTYPSADKLFRNEGLGPDGHPKFVDVSKQSGIVYEGYGLGIVVSDINRDGWPDIYCSNDFISNDILYINNGDGTFHNAIKEAFTHQSFNGMGVDVADFNNDLMPDILQLDMLPEDNARQKKMLMPQPYDRTQMSLSSLYTEQYIRNVLQVSNNSPGDKKLSFTEIGQMAGVEKTDWSWAPLFADFDNDGWKDIFITNGYRKDVTNLDFVVYTKDPGVFADKKKLNKEMARLIPEVNIPNYAYRNNHDLTFEDVSAKWGIDIPSYSNGAVYADLDNDGDLDLVVNNIDEEAFIFQNTTRDELQKIGETKRGHNYLRIKFAGDAGQVIGAKATVWCGGQGQYAELSVVRGYKSSVEPILHFGLGSAAKVDSLRIDWPSGKVTFQTNVLANQVLLPDQRKALPAREFAQVLGTANKLFEEVTASFAFKFHHQENTSFVDFKRQPALPFMHSRNGFGIAVGDINGDALEDFYAGNAYGANGIFFLQESNGKFVERPMLEDTVHEDMGVLFFDADNDRDLDLYVVSGGNEKNPNYTEFYQDRLYLNDGKGNFKHYPNALPLMNKSGACVTACDFDKDGDLDLFAGGRLQVSLYPMAARSYLLQNNGKGKFTDVTTQVAPELTNPGLVTSAMWSDFDNDGYTDLIVAGEWMPVTFFKNDQGRLRLQKTANGIERASGFWNSIVGGDFDNDGDVDYVVGNLGLNTRYHASVKEPIKIIAKDFNNDGLYDPFMGHYYLGECYPSAPRDAMIQQYIPFRAKFKSYDSYATTTFDNLFSEKQKKDAFKAEINTLESVYIENKGSGNFDYKPLPMLAQVSPIFGMTVDDFDADGNLDIAVSGNFYAMEANGGPCNAFRGLYLQGHGNGNFNEHTPTDCGLLIQGDAKGMAMIHMGDGNRVILSAINGKGITANAVNSISKGITIPDGAQYAILSLRNEKKRKQEFYYGSGYLSSSSRLLEKNDAIIKIEFIH
jgi:enediyne biosynthesis protein E4